MLALEQPREGVDVLFGSVDAPVAARAIIEDESLTGVWAGGRRCARVVIHGGLRPTGTSGRNPHVVTKDEQGRPVFPEVWITKFALTQGVGVYRVKNAVLYSPYSIYVEGGYRESFYYKNEWHPTRKEAMARVREMVASRRKAMARSEAKLKSLLTNLTTMDWPMRSRS